MSQHHFARSAVRAAASALAAACLLIPARASHAQIRVDSMAVRTFALRSMTATDAAKLVAPYIRSARGGVFDVAGARAITVRDFPDVLKTVDSLLSVYDRAPQTVRLTFQLITTTDTDARDPAIAPVETALRGIFRFPGYKLIAQSTAIAREQAEYETTMAGNGRRYSVAGTISRITQGPDASARLMVSLTDATTKPTLEQVQVRFMSMGGRVLSTDLTTPLGQTVVLGSGAPEDGGNVLILVVRAELVGAPASR